MIETEDPSMETLQVKFNDQGLVPAIVQDADTGQVLMLGWMNQEALSLTLTTQKATFFSRSRGKLWVKGETSGHTQEVIDARIDCDQDTVLLRCKSKGPCCHVGYKSCFYRKVNQQDQLTVVEEKLFDPDKIY